MVKSLIVLSFLLISHTFNVFSAEIRPDEILAYRSVNGRSLNLHVFYPDGMKAGKDRTAVIHFFGGGWMGGTPRQFYEQCEYLSSIGIVAISAEYRLMKDDGITPFDCVEDAKKAISYVRENSGYLGISAYKIVASGGSAGGYLALCTAVFSDDENLSSVPNALVLYNPVLDTSDKGYGKNKFSGNELSLSPNHNLKKGLPPVLILHGTQDHTVPFANAHDFDAKMKQLKNDCSFIPVWGMDHGFFNGSYFRKSNGDAMFRFCMSKVLSFLNDLSFLPSDVRLTECKIPVFYVLRNSDKKEVALLQKMLGDNYHVTEWNISDKEKYIKHIPTVLVAELDKDTENTLAKFVSEQTVKPSVFFYDKKNDKAKMSGIKVYPIKKIKECDSLHITEHIYDEILNNLLK